MNVTFLIESFLMGVATSVAISLAIGFGILRRRHLAIRLIVVILGIALLTMPAFFGIATLRDDVLNPKRYAAPDRIQGVMLGLDPPLTVEKVRYFKNSVYETWLCSIDEETLVAWCEAMSLDGGERERRREDRSYDNFSGIVAIDTIPDLYYASETAPNGAQAVVFYYRTPGIAIYECNYW